MFIEPKEGIIEDITTDVKVKGVNLFSMNN